MFGPKTFDGIVAPMRTVINNLSAHIERQERAIDKHNETVDEAYASILAANEEASKSRVAMERFKALLGEAA